MDFELGNRRIDLGLNQRKLMKGKTMKSQAFAAVHIVSNIATANAVSHFFKSLLPLPSASAQTYTQGPNVSSSPATTADVFG